MHYFTGNVSTGVWTWRDITGKHHSMTPSEVKASSSIVWIRTEDSGEFFWPHVRLTPNSRPVAMEYDD